MPGWLKAWVALGTACIVAVCILAAIVFMSTLTREGEAPFTNQQKIDLAENAQGGTYVTPSLYRYCGQDSVFWYIDSARRLWTNNERCATWMRGR